MELQPQHAEQIREALLPSLRYLSRLKDRMQQVGFLPGDHLYRIVAQAHEAVHHLAIELHYRSCAGGVGRNAPKADPFPDD